MLDKNETNIYETIVSTYHHHPKKISTYHHQQNNMVSKHVITTFIQITKPN